MGGEGDCVRHVQRGFRRAGFQLRIGAGSFNVLVNFKGNSLALSGSGPILPKLGGVSAAHDAAIGALLNHRSVVSLDLPVQFHIGLPGWNSIPIQFDLAVGARAWGEVW